jgi:hypothetical protein
MISIGLRQTTTRPCPHPRLPRLRFQQGADRRGLTDVMPGHGFNWRGCSLRIAALDNRAARMLSADNIHPLARPLLSADNNLFQDWWNLARVWLAFPPSPIVDKFARSSIFATISYFIRRPCRLTSGTTVSRAGFLEPALLMDRTEAIDGEVGLPVGWSFPMTRRYRSISPPAWCLPKPQATAGWAA